MPWTSPASRVNSRTKLMTGFLGPTSVNPLSRLTGASLGDLGYSVALSETDDHSIPACSLNCLLAPNEARQLQEIILLPKAMVEPDGTVVPLAPSD